MSELVNVSRGVRVLRQLLQYGFDVRCADVDSFRKWLVNQLNHWQQNPSYLQQCLVRDLYQAHPELVQLEKEYAEALAVDDESPAKARLLEIENQLHRANSAIAGIEKALKKTEAAKKPALAEKLKNFQVTRTALEKEAARLEQESPERRALLDVSRRLDALRQETGMAHARAKLEVLQKNQGHQANATGESFETVALRISQDQILPRVVSGSDPRARARLAILTGAKLGASRLEIDQLIVRRPLQAGRSVDVLALVEVKRNINDLAHGFVMRQENLAWRTGDDTGYDVDEYRTQSFPLGTFDRPAIHREHDEDFLLDARSFHLFRRDPSTQWFMDRLYLITRWGRFWGMSNGSFAQLRNRMATDPTIDLESDESMSELLQWCQFLTNPLETPDVLQLYCDGPKRTQNVLIVEKP
ncbi:MAG: hypothetical protein ACFCD0_02365 [Gemmataceae bacterium]